MRIKVRSILGVSLVISIATMLLTLLWLWILGAEMRYWLVAPIVTFAIIYLLSRFIINSFVVFRIKPIYQILLSRNIRTSQIPRRLDVVEGIEDQINKWAERNAEEITRLKANEQYRKEFLGDVSHEMKTPIFTMQGYILTLLDGGVDDEKIKYKYLERTEKSIDRLINIVNDLEEISKLESGRLILDLERFDVIKMAHDIADEVEIEAVRKGISIIVGDGEFQQAMLVNADSKRISQVISNLLSNSIKYGKSGGNTKISFIDGFDKVVIEVSDDGVGLSSEDKVRVFDRFFRVDKSRSREQGGTGLGLAIVKHIIEAHGEAITLRSELGSGTTFSFTLSKN